MAVEIDLKVIGADIEMGEAWIDWLVKYLPDLRLCEVDGSEVERSSLGGIKFMQRERLEDEEDDLVGQKINES